MLFKTVFFTNFFSHQVPLKIQVIGRDVIPWVGGPNPEPCELAPQGTPRDVVDRIPACIVGGPLLVAPRPRRPEAPPLLAAKSRDYQAAKIFRLLDYWQPRLFGICCDGGLPWPTTEPPPEP